MLWGFREGFLTCTAAEVGNNLSFCLPVSGGGSI